MAAKDFFVDVAYPRDLEAAFYAAVEARHSQTIEESQANQWHQRFSFGLAEQAMNFAAASCAWLRNWNTTCQGEPFTVTLPDGQTVAGTVGEHVTSH